MWLYGGTLLEICKYLELGICSLSLIYALNLIDSVKNCRFCDFFAYLWKFADCVKFGLILWNCANLTNSKVHSILSHAKLGRFV